MATLYKDEYEKLKLRLAGKSTSNLVLSTSYARKVKFATISLLLVTINLLPFNLFGFKKEKVGFRYDL